MLSYNCWLLCKGAVRVTDELLTGSHRQKTRWPAFLEIPGDLIACYPYSVILRIRPISVTGEINNDGMQEFACGYKRRTSLF